MSTVYAYRLVKTKWLSNAFTGDGAKLYGGRWNSKGMSCVYLASSESLAILEIFVHLEDYSLLQNYTLLQVKLPQSEIQYVDREHLPKCWQDQPAPPETAALGDDWLRSCQSMVLAVPSAVVPREWNYLLNPEHEKFSQVVKRVENLPFLVDARLWRK
ncbi:RES family NAD+ phosphorylase [Caedibacter taeniospiralis]|uniref:RES family NAD+ phosphorylase n=1 Tax=Caedibacter taeniospiralis TaxID=28907 RepID=UPI0037C01A5B